MIERSILALLLVGLLIGVIAVVKPFTTAILFGAALATAVWPVGWGVFVNAVDNFIKPWLIGFGVAMPLSLTILGVFGGFVAFGFLGLFIWPTLIAIVFTLFQAWGAAVSDHPSAEFIKPAA